jgi:hypothetical protein
MAPSIQVEKLDGQKFQVRVIEGKSKTTHHVRLSEEDYHRLSGGKIAPEELIRRSFEFLLLREPKESILREFDLPLIGRYFPEYERELRRKI